MGVPRLAVKRPVMPNPPSQEPRSTSRSARCARWRVVAARFAGAEELERHDKRVGASKFSDTEAGLREAPPSVEDVTFANAFVMPCRAFNPASEHGPEAVFNARASVAR